MGEGKWLFVASAVMALMLKLPDIQSQAPQTRSILQDDLLAMRLTLPVPSLQPLFQFCNFPSVADATRIGVCNDLANLFIGHDKTMQGLGIGAKFAQTAAWPQPRIEELNKTKAEYQAAFAASVAQQSEKGSSDCGELAAFDRWAADYSSLGDRGVAMKFIEEASSRTRTSR